jgi:hypothetical protein
MENVEGQTPETNVTAEGHAADSGLNEILEQVAALKSTNERLLAQSKENAEKYRSLRDKTEAKEKLELEESENWKTLLDKEKNDHHQLRESFNSLKKTTLKKDLNFNIAKLIGSTPLNKGVTVDHVIDEVLRTGIVEVNEDESEFLNVSEAFDKVRNDSIFLFDSKKAPMANTVPQGKVPTDKPLNQMTKSERDEAFKANIASLIKNDNRR